MIMMMSMIKMMMVAFAMHGESAYFSLLLDCYGYYFEAKKNSETATNVQCLYTAGQQRLGSQLSRIRGCQGLNMGRQKLEPVSAVTARSSNIEFEKKLNFTTVR